MSLRSCRQRVAMSQVILGDEHRTVPTERQKIPGGGHTDSGDLIEPLDVEAERGDDGLNAGVEGLNLRGQQSARSAHRCVPASPGR